MKKSLVADCRRLLPDSVSFEEAKTFYWSPKNQTVYVDNSSLLAKEGQWALLHEVSHALLNHRRYESDLALLQLELAAWEKAKELGRKLDINIDESHIEDCLNTYRDWLYARSTCPTCRLNSLQISQTKYMCVNCLTDWSVSQSRFCRPYRMQGRQQKTPPESKTQTVFQ